MSVFLQYLQLTKYEDGRASFEDESGEQSLDLALEQWNQLERAEYVSVTVRAVKP